ncbi:MAG: metallopeptidase family protein [Trueperaceae bacterium]|nr:metallopeptidase family protein [Truepera sp.]HRN18132.1 metallopeptidase family protein [Trueperaceae bacterium]HRQ09796.1 metallopeptidase family protein [Trueperaceae bacterium]
MSFEEFQGLIAEMVDEIPAEFLRGLSGVHVLEEALVEPDYDDVYRMGEYLDPGVQDFLGPGEGLGRHVALYYGSFAALAASDPGFDWEDEAWETLTHELRHHVESLAGEDWLIQDDEFRAQDFPKRN